MHCSVKPRIVISINNSPQVLRIIQSVESIEYKSDRRCEKRERLLIIISTDDRDHCICGTAFVVSITLVVVKFWDSFLDGFEMSSCTVSY